MRLINDFFTIRQQEAQDGKLSYIIELNADHLIYTGHFPGQPVTPAVIQMQVVQELLEYHLRKSLFFQRLPVSKFLHILNPQLVSHLHVHIAYQVEESGIKVKATGEQYSIIFFRLSAEFIFLD
ncbi:MAG: hypothetical protein AAF587_07430 [Bacteroidota bacterium]